MKSSLKALLLLAVFMAQAAASAPNASPSRDAGATIADMPSYESDEDIIFSLRSTISLLGNMIAKQPGSAGTTDYYGLRQSAQTNYIADEEEEEDEATSTGTGLYFPDWGDSNGCKLDEGDAPYWMRDESSAWMEQTLEACCQRYFGWYYNQCATGGNAIAR